MSEPVVITGASRTPGTTLVTTGNDGGDSSPLQTFVTGVLAVTGASASDTRLFWVAQTGDTTTSTTKDAAARTVTWDGDVSGRLSAQGFGVIQSFDGVANQGVIPDDATLSFGNGVSDTPFSIVSLCDVTNTAAVKYLLSKFVNGAGGMEWFLRYSSNEQLVLGVANLTSVTPIRTSTAGITSGLHLVGGTYSAATGGATAANDMTVFDNASVAASSATNQATYTAMSDTTSNVNIGGRNGALFFSGSAGFTLLTAKILSAADHATIKALANTYYGLSL